MRRSRAGAAAFALTAGLVVAALAFSTPVAQAGPTPASPAVYVVGESSGGVASVASFTLGGLLAGGTNAGQLSGVPAGAQVGPVAISPDDRFAAVGVDEQVGLGSEVDEDVVVVNLTSGTAATVVLAQFTFSPPVALAMDPSDPTRVYALGTGGEIYSVDMANPSQAPEVLALLAPGSSTVDPSSLAISPDGGTVFAAGLYVPGLGNQQGFIAAIPVDNPGGAFYCESTCVASDGAVDDVAVSPDGTQLFASGFGGGATFFKLGLPLSAGSTTTVLYPPGLDEVVPQGGPITVSPDSKTVYGAYSDDGPSSVAALPASASGPIPEGQLDQLAIADFAASSLAVSPDGHSLVVSGSSLSTELGEVYTVGLTPGLEGPPAQAGGTSGGSGIEGVAIAPDQAPVARLAPASGTAGTPVTLSAAASTVAYGSITSYHWVFGDGQQATTPGPTVSHPYAAPGDYTATVTEADSAGNSVPPAPGSAYQVNSAGTTPYLDASPSARASAPVVISPRPPPPTTSTTSTTAPPPPPVLVLNPGIGPPGTIVTVTGSGFPPDTPITVSWSVSSGSVVITSDSHGDLAPTPLLVLTPDVLGPRFAVASGTPQAKAPFLVVPGSAEPGGSSRDYIFRSEGP